MGTTGSTARRYRARRWAGCGFTAVARPTATPLLVVDRQECDVPVNADCRHYVMQTAANGEKLERCKIDAGEQLPFSCPDGCIFYEPRRVSSAGWQVQHNDVPPPSDD